MCPSITGHAQSINAYHAIIKNYQHIPPLRVNTTSINVDDAPGTKALIYVDLTQRTTWGTHAIYGRHVGQVKQHCRCYKFFILDTNEYRIAQTVKISCTHENEKYIATSTHLISVKTLTKTLLTYTHINPLHSTSTKALQHLADIYTTKAENNDDKENGEVHRVKLIPRPTTSQDTTNKNTILQTKQVNQKTTRANTPIFEQPIIQSPIIILDDNLHALNILTPEDDGTPPRWSRSRIPSP